MNRKRTRNLIAGLTLALAFPLLGSASAQALTGTVTITDIPAQHWARDAVALLIQRGVITGYPDGTFQGNSALTRYELAVILTRVIDSGVLFNSPNLSAGDMDVVQRGVGSVADEIRIVREQMALLSSTVMNHDDALKVQAAGLNDLSTAATIDRSRIEQLEVALGMVRGQLAQMEQERVAEAMAALNTPADTSLPASAAAGREKQPTFVEDPTMIQDAAFREPVEGASTVTMNPGKLGVAGGVEYIGGRVAPSAAISYQATPNLGLEAYGGLLTGDVPGFFGGASGQYFFGSPQSDIRPYVSLGGGALSSESREGANGESATDFYVRGGLGAEYRLSSTLLLRGEALGNYFTSANGLGANQGFDFGARAGVKVLF